MKHYTLKNGTKVGIQKPNWDTDDSAGWGPFRFGDTKEAREHDLGAIMCSTEECHRLNDENFLRNLRFKFKKKRTVGHLWEMGQGYAVKIIAKIFPFWHRNYSRLKEWLAWKAAERK